MFLVLWCLSTFAILSLVTATLFVLEWRKLYHKEQQEAEEHHQWQKRRCRYPIDFDERPIIDYDGDGLGGWST